MARKEALTMAKIQQIIDEMSDEDEVTSIVYVPPPVEVVSDEEDIDEDVIIGHFIDDPSPLNEIAGEIEIEYNDAHNIEDFGAALVSSNDELPVAYKPIQEFGNPIWTNAKRIRYDNQSHDEPSILEDKIKRITESLAGKTPIELFSLFFDEELIAHIVEQTNIYTTQGNQREFCSPNLLKRFIGILILSGYHSVPQAHLYWSNQPDSGVDIVKHAMPRNTFMLMKKNLHFNDNTKLDINDKFSKLRPLFEILNRKFLQFGVFAKYLSIDEQMVPYFGRHSSKMFIRGKPVRFGFKNWCICSAEGYLFCVIPYMGASVMHDKKIGLGAQTVLQLLECVERPELHQVFFDNFFTSYYLLCLLNERRFLATGTIRNNRMNGAKLKTGRALKKGEYDSQFDKTNKLLIVRWQDNAEVTVATNFDSIEPLHSANRYSRKEKKSIAMTQPSLIHNYNNYIGGVDLHDNGVANYRINVRGKKWWWPMWTNALSSALVNAWQLHVLVAKAEHQQPMTQLMFRSSIARQLMLAADEGENVRNPRKESLPRNLPDTTIRDHAVELLPGQKKLRCKQCHKTCRYQCIKCNITLHPKNCFVAFHNARN